MSVSTGWGFISWLKLPTLRTTGPCTVVTLFILGLSSVHLYEAFRVLITIGTSIHLFRFVDCFHSILLRLSFFAHPLFVSSFYRYFFVCIEAYADEKEGRIIIFIRQ